VATVPVLPEPVEGGASLPRLTTGEFFNPHISECGFNVMRAVMADTSQGLSNGQKLVFLSLLQFAGKNSKCFPSHGRLAASLGRGDVRGVARDVKKLVESGLVHPVCRDRPTGGQTSNRYFFKYHWIYDLFRREEKEQLMENEVRKLQRRGA
jgi:hypothetical protein